MFRNTLARSRLGAVVTILAASLATTAAAATSATSTTSAPNAPSALPSPSQFVANLDLECFRTSPYTPPPLPQVIVLNHLNPVLVAANAGPQAPWIVGGLGPRTHLCTPVAKNGVNPPPAVLAFIRFVDLSCYQMPGPNINFPLTLQHLNPQLGHLPRRQVVMQNPEQLCVPVIKNNSIPPAEVLSLVRFIDLVCFRTAPQLPLNHQLTLTQLNPVLAAMPPANVLVRENRQLCVPVRKNNQAIPANVLNILRWIDLERFDLAISAPVPAVNLALRHINPLLAGLPIEPATLLAPPQLALPVAKNGQVPPTG